MLKFTFLYLIMGTVVLIACNADPEIKKLNAEIDRLQHQVDSAYKPGLGEFMLGIQTHHEKLWIAGKAENWNLAGFEMGEIRETLDDINRYCKDRSEINELPMIQPALDSIDASIKSKNTIAFANSFSNLTNTCNRCHQATKHEFNVIKIPETSSFGNQVFIPAGGIKMPH